MNIFHTFFTVSVFAFPLMFLIYINDLPDNIRSGCNIFADDIFIFSHILNEDTSQDELNYDLQKASDWVFQWKM